MSWRLCAVALIAACGSNDGDKPAPDDAGPVAAAVPAPRTSMPSATAIDRAKKVVEPRVFTFFPPGPVADQVAGYLADLAKQSGVAIEVRELDRLIHVEEAKRFRIARDGVIVLVSGDASETVEMHVDGAAADADLARLDRKVGRALDRIGRGTRQVALVKHRVADIDRYIVLDQTLAAFGYAVSTVTPGKQVPAGALAIFLDVGAGPTRPAMDTIDRHLAAGGAALIAIEPRAGASLGPVGKRLGLRLAAGALADDKQHLVQRKDTSDNRLLVTNKFAAHPSLADLNRMSARAGLVFRDPGALEEVGEPAAGLSRVVTIRSMPSAFLDRDGNHVRGAREAAREHAIAAAVSGRCRALVFADASWLANESLGPVPNAQVLLVDATRWLSGEESLEGQTADDAPATGEQLTSYPLRSSAAASARTALWQGTADGVQAVRFESRGRMVLLERRDDGLWGRVARPTADGAGSVREFPLAPEGHQLFAALAAPVPIRTVGPLDATTRARYGLDDGTLTVDVSGGATHKVLVGARVMGGNDRYAADPTSRAVVILPASMIEPLEGERLAVRRPIDRDEKTVSRLVISHGDRSREATREATGAWTVPGGGSDEAYLAEEIARAAFRLIPIEFAQPRTLELVPAGRVTITAGTEPPLDLELFVRGDQFWIRTPLTRGVARVSEGAARRLVDAIEQLLAE